MTKRFTPREWLANIRGVEEAPQTVAEFAIVAASRSTSQNQESDPQPEPEKNLDLKAATIAPIATDWVPLDDSPEDAFSRLQVACPEYIDPPIWRRTVSDGKIFMEQWGWMARELGWTGAELFGLPAPPDNPVPWYDRLARYDTKGLIWLLHGRTVTDMTGTTATIKHPSGSETVYRKENKPGLGPLGDSLDDLK
jgi:hypothetical protein